MAGVAIYIRDPGGLILSAARKNDHTQWTLPGGKLEPGETFEEAAYRELFEETGIQGVSLEFLWAGVNSWNNEICVTYGIDYYAWSSLFENTSPIEDTSPISYFNLNPGPGEAPASWQAPHVLANGVFGDYNKELFDYLGVSYGSQTDVYECGQLVS